MGGWKDENEKTKHKKIWVSLGALTAFALWTLPVCHVDVRPIGPGGSRVGLAAVNQAFHAMTGVHWLSDIVGGMLLSMGLMALYAFAVSLREDR